MRRVVLALILFNLWPMDSMAGDLPYLKIKSILEESVSSMTDATIPATLTAPSGLRPFKGMARLMSSTGAYCMTSSTTSSIGITVPQFTEILLGVQSDGLSWWPRELHSSQFTGDWIFRFYYR